ncbi:MAG: leucyl/phenylalanyl-tRNA--protein transferase [Spirochaetaceae bacterium]|jgi:leucyl/phenylalanyl-tRNA--protein transferase|nr:leucyl/phenylalanyl-tRNA--protein transferase [Spirochaetaceae bacterium]
MTGHEGPDPRFPYLLEHDRFQFPDPETAVQGIVASGGNLSPGMLLSAYEQGLFPWYNPGEPVLWHSPDPRFVLFPQKLHISSSMAKVFRRGIFELRFDTAFSRVIENCAAVHRPRQHGTWINTDVIAAYTELYQLGYAHCAESYFEGELAGGCYGILLGQMFFGESMFARYSNASKAAFIGLAEQLFDAGITLIDCQVPTVHLASLGAEEIPRRRFLKLLNKALLNGLSPKIDFSKINTNCVRAGGKKDNAEYGQEIGIPCNEKLPSAQYKK